jgi:hypothetical protein
LESDKLGAPGRRLQRRVTGGTPHLANVAEATILVVKTSPGRNKR